MEFMSDRLEKVLLEDEADPTGNDFGLFEKRVAHVTFLLTLSPFLSLPILKYFSKQYKYTLLIISAIIFGIFLIIQHRFQYIVWLTERLNYISSYARV